MSLKNVASGFNVSNLGLNYLPSNSVGKGGETITVTMRGQTPAAHADAILEHYKFTKADETKFKELYGFDLRQDLTDAYAKKDNRAAHTALGKGLYRVEIPITKELLAQIRTVKSANQQPAAQPQDIKQAVAEKNGYDQAAMRRAQIENSFPNNPVPQPIPQPAPTPIKVDRVKPVSEMSSDEKVQEALTRMIPMLPDSMREKVQAMMTPEAIGTLTVVLGAWTVGHYFGISEVIDVLAVVGLIAAGVEVADIGQKLYDGANLAMSAQTSEEMDAAAKKFADAFGGATVDVAAAVVMKKAGGAMEEGINNLPKLPPPSPQLATPNGILVPSVARPAVLETQLPIWTTPATAPSTDLLANKILGNQKPEDNLLFSKQANPLGERRTLADHERLGGHTTRDHVGKSETQLRNRLIKNPKLDDTSSFRNEDVANRTVGQFIKQNKEAIINWLQSGRHDYRGTVEMDESVGIVVGRGKGGSANRGTAAETNKAFFMLVKDDSPQGWHILTSYPVK